MTQEQLAMLLGVTRQAISKWESEKAYPEMDKLLMICDLFGCTLDDLVLGDVRNPGQTVAGTSNAGNTGIAESKSAPFTSGGSEQKAVAESGFVAGPAGEGRTGDVGEAQNTGVSDATDSTKNTSNANGTNFVMNGAEGTSGTTHTGSAGFAGSANAANGADMAAPTNGFAAYATATGNGTTGGAGVKDVTGYDAQMKGFAWKIAVGIGAMAAGVAFAADFGGPSTPMTDALSFLFISIGAVVGIALVLLGTSSRREFMRKHPYIEDFYTDEDRSRGNIIFIVCLVAGIAEACMGIVVNQLGYSVFGLGDGDGGWPDVVMLLLFALAAASIIYGALRRSMLRIERYNRRCERREDWKGKANHDFSDLRDCSQYSAMSSTSSGRFYRRLSGSVDGIIMLVATLIGLLMLFLGHETGMGPGFLGFPFWLIWPVGGVICAIVDGVFYLVYVSNTRSH